MIKIEIFRKNNNICRFKLSGHAGYSQAGQDIVCAAVSMLVINTINSIETLTEAEIICSYSNDGGELDCSLPGIISGKCEKDASLLLEAMVLGLNSVKQEHGEYILISNREV